jgi:hypothetical protein
MKRLFMMSVLAAFLVLPGPGCSDGKDGRGRRSGASRLSAAELADANAVAGAFIQALRAKDKYEVLSHVHPDNRKDMEEELDDDIAGDGWPEMPADLKPKVKVTETSEGMTGEIQCDVYFIRGLGMRFDQGRWWITD